MTKLRIILVAALGALALPLFAASAAQADTATCSFSGAAGPLVDDDSEGPPNNGEDGVESLVTDFQHGDEGDSTGPPTQLTDSDNGNGHTGAGAEDGSYSFSSNTASCLLDDTTDDGAPGQADDAPDGLYVGSISSEGHYNNTECGTGTASDDVTFGNQGASTVASGTRVGGSESIEVSTDYSIVFTAGQGVLDVDQVDDTGNGSHRVGVTEDNDNTHDEQDGAVSIQPDGVGGDGGGDNCVTTDVNRFLASGTFTVG